MHINWATAVPFPGYASSYLQETLRQRVSEATDDDLLAAYLHWLEGRIAHEFGLAAKDFEARIRTEQEHLAVLLPTTRGPFAMDFQRAHQALRSILDAESRVAGTSMQQAQDVWRHLREQTGHDVTARYKDGVVPAFSGLESIGSLKQQVDQSELRVVDAMARYRDEMHSLALREQEMDRFLASDDSLALDDIHAMTPSAFEQAVAALARRDGYDVIRDGGGARDLGADVIAVTPDRLRVVFQCKHRQAGLGKVGSPDIQTLNGTARPEHKADIVVAVTNGTFTKPASDFAQSHSIHLLCQARLKRWATWGEPLLAVLDVAKTRAQDPMAA
ncbi:restriction endonuclease [Streptomyces mauvecolor]|uniref:Restriction endonuclease n=1 Tax=Streptomyces mauvecolor TaxID=58345 RepID=A0ABV9UHC3_9ACTN